MTRAYDRLARPVQAWIRDQGWADLREIQSRAVAAVMDGGEDLIIAASTAGGKTEAAFLPLISQVLEAGEGRGFDLVYIGPLKALITDQAKRLESICAGAELPVTPWHGDVSQSRKTAARRRPRGILLITPESLEGMFLRGGQGIPTLFGRTRAVVIDELHSLLDSERGTQLRSLLARLELATGRAIRRVGLSATLGDMNLARAYLRPEAPERVRLIEDRAKGSDLRIGLRGYLTGPGEDEAGPTVNRVAEDLFARLRGANNLVFAGSRKQVETYTDRLHAMTERARLPEEFFAHHGSLSKEHRDFVETRLKEARLPTTAVCTSTLELGIDIGDVVCVAQVGPPYTVAGLRQRLGRSGRRAGQPAVLRQFVIEAPLEKKSALPDLLRLELVRTIAMIELLLAGWCEPPKAHSLHLSTLTHQILAVIAERGGASARRLRHTLCERGPFRAVDAETFAETLRQLGREKMIEQAGDGLLLLGAKGEALVEARDFVTVFRTSEEYRLLNGPQDLGALPVDAMLTPGMYIIFAGRRWEVIAVHDAERVIEVKPAEAGAAPRFAGGVGDLHDRVIAEMAALWRDSREPSYLDETARELLAEGRRGYARLGFGAASVLTRGPRTHWIATGRGTVGTLTLALALQAQGFRTESHDGFLEVRGEGPLRAILQRIARGERVELAWSDATLNFEKFHPYLSTELLRRDALSSRLDLEGLPGTAQDILSRWKDPRGAAEAR